MSEIKIVRENLESKYGKEVTNIDKILREKEQAEREQKIVEVLNMLEKNPDLTEDMVRPDLRKVLGVAKREYKKNIIRETSNRLR